MSERDFAFDPKELNGMNAVVVVSCKTINCSGWTVQCNSLCNGRAAIGARYAMAACRSCVYARLHGATLRTHNVIAPELNSPVP